MSCKHNPDFSSLPEELDSSMAYLVPCTGCGLSLMIRKKGCLRQATKIAGDIKLPFDEVNKSYLEHKRITHVIDLKKIKTKPTTAEMKNFIYDLLADGDIDIDQFNTLISKVK